MASANDPQHQTDSLLLLSRGSYFLRRSHAITGSEKAFVTCSARLPSQFIQAHAYGCPIQPALRLTTVSLLIPPQFQKHLNCEFLSPRRTSHYSCDDASDALILSTKDCLDIKLDLLILALSACFAGCA